MLRIFHLMNLSQRYHGTKGYLETQQEEPPLGQSGVPCLPGGECFAPHCYGRGPSWKIMKNDVPNNDSGALRWCLGVTRNALE